MAEVVVKVEVPAEYEKGIREFTRMIDLNDLLFKSLEHNIRIELKKKLLREIASGSKLTDMGALKLGDEIKEGIAKRHGVS